MSKRRDLQLDAFGISKWRYRELLNFCLQYSHWKAELRKYSRGSLPHRSLEEASIQGQHSDPTGNLATRRVILAGKCELIEQAALEAAGEFYPFLLQAVTNDDISYCYLQSIKGLNCSEREFMSIRRYFYCLLDKKRP